LKRVAIAIDYYVVSLDHNLVMIVIGKVVSELSTLVIFAVGGSTLPSALI